MDTPTHFTAPAPLPAWTRFPRDGEREPISGVSRATLYRWRDAGLIVVKNVRRMGQIRGVALISVPSLLECIEQGGAPERRPDPSANAASAA